MIKTPAQKGPFMVVFRPSIHILWPSTGTPNRVRHLLVAYKYP